MRMPRSKGMVIGFWIATALFCLQMGFTAYAELRLPQVAEAFAHLGFPAYFRVELAWAKLIGIVVLLAPAPARLKEWVYAGFAFTLVSALIAHLSMGEGPEAWGFAAGTGVLVDERCIVNAMVALLATGGPTNHLIHWVAVSRAAGILIAPLAPVSP